MRKVLSSFERESLNLLDFAYKRLVNYFKINKNEGYPHLNGKYEVCKVLVENDLNFVTEARFKAGGRADIFVLEPRVSIEILFSEKLDDAVEKSRKYPCRVYFHRAEDLFDVKALF